MSSYETMYILLPSLSEEQTNEVIEKYRSFISDYEAKDINIQNLGRRRLAYEIARQTEGIYVQMNYQADGQHVAPMQRAMRLSDEVIRCLTLKVTDQETEAPAPEPVEAEA